MVTPLLGPVEVRDGSAPLRLGGRKPRALLARPAPDADRTAPAGRLVEDLSGEDAPGTAAKTVQIHGQAAWDEKRGRLVLFGGAFGSFAA